MPPANKSIAEIRQAISRERERELGHKKAADSNPNRARQETKRGADYATLREKKLAQERRYHGGAHHFVDEKRDNGDYSDGGHKARFGRERNHGWDEEETDLMQWTRNQAHASAHHLPQHARARTPPAVDSPRLTPRSSLRSISAPNVAPPPLTGISALGEYEDSHVKRLRQLKYAEELRSQMRNQMKGKDHGSQRGAASRVTEDHYDAGGQWENLSEPIK